MRRGHVLTRSSTQSPAQPRDRCTLSALGTNRCRRASADTLGLMHTCVQGRKHLSNSGTCQGPLHGHIHKAPLAIGSRDTSGQTYRPSQATDTTPHRASPVPSPAPTCRTSSSRPVKHQRRHMAPHTGPVALLPQPQDRESPQTQEWIPRIPSSL